MDASSQNQRLFVGLPLSPETLLALAELIRALRPLAPVPCAWTRPGTWHVTLKFLGDTPAGRVAKIADALAGVHFSSFALRPGPAMTFPFGARPRVLTLSLADGGPQCAALARAVETALIPLGFLPEKRPFSPHITLARVKYGRRDNRPASPGGPARPNAWPNSLARAEALILPETVVDRFVLWRSLLAGDPDIARCGLSGPGHLPLRVFAAEPARM